MNFNKLCFCLTVMAIMSGLIACADTTSETEPAAPTDQLAQAPPQVTATPQLGAGTWKVVQKQDASSYTYVGLNDGAGNEIWAAIPKTQIEIGEQIALKGGTVMRNFSSKTLNRTFDSIIFATGIVRASGDQNAQAPAASMVASDITRSGIAAHDLTSQSRGGSSRATVPFIDLKIEKSTAQNGYTVGELFAKAASLNKQKVTVKGQVVKVNPEIMGKNWIHIQDGTGDPSKNTHDLVVTSADIPEKGAVISIEGVLAADKDFSFGYRYDVIVEDAVLVK